MFYVIASSDSSECGNLSLRLLLRRITPRNDGNYNSMLFSYSILNSDFWILFSSFYPINSYLATCNLHLITHYISLITVF